jgi:hypothetical protein
MVGRSKSFAYLQIKYRGAQRVVKGLFCAVRIYGGSREVAPLILNTVVLTAKKDPAVTVI